ncbi:MAG: TRAM domain-containing protein [Candidatus Competibacteraceae bacterium]|nr:TRAM domain-containing protein [Candidatus Competibacteraceae bacterium]
MAKKRQAWATAEPFVVRIEDLTHDGRGVARRDGKAVFVEGALPGEEVSCLYTARRSRHDEARIVALLAPSLERVEPRCAHFGVCGGCALQHLAPTGQLAIKQRWLLNSLAHIAKARPEQMLEPMTGPQWGYRRRARLGVKWVAKKNRVLVGFHERHSAYIADIRRCEVLDQRIGGLLEELARLIETLSIRDRLPQIEVAGGDTLMSLSFRVLASPSATDLAQLRAFSEHHGLLLYLQPDGPASVRPLAEPRALRYRLPAFDLNLEFQPSHFIQVNAAINRQLIERAVTQRNAGHNGIVNASFHAADLSRIAGNESWLQGGYDRVLLDPPRSGALELMPYMAALDVRRIVYVSCHPATLARDVGELVHRFGYHLAAAGILDMFPQTAHVESMAILTKK